MYLGKEHCLLIKGQSREGAWCQSRLEMEQKFLLKEDNQNQHYSITLKGLCRKMNIFLKAYNNK
jgi:hypothetical protein